MAKSFMIQSWMIEKMCLNGNMLVLFALLYQVTDHGAKEYTDGYPELAKAMGTTIPTAYNTVKKLVENGYVATDGDGRAENLRIRLIIKNN